MFSGKKYIFVFLLAVISMSSVFGQLGRRDRYPYNYTITIHHNPTERSYLTKDNVTGIADTSVAIVQGHVYDCRNVPLEAAYLIFSGKLDSIMKGCSTDSLGFFQVFLPADIYQVSIKSVLYTTYTIKQTEVKTGEIREMECKLGAYAGISDYIIMSDKKLSEKELEEKKEWYKCRSN